jgi:hypothetical protein
MKLVCPREHQAIDPLSGDQKRRLPAWLPEKVPSSSAGNEWSEKLTTYANWNW